MIAVIAVIAIIAIIAVTIAVIAIIAIIAVTIAVAIIGSGTHCNEGHDSWSQLQGGIGVEVNLH